AYSRHVFETVGGYDERLVRTEDNEMHYRLRKNGFKFYYNPEVRSFHISRGSLRALLKQKYSNGLWIGLTMGIQPRCFSLRHFIPLFFVLVLLGSVLSVMIKNFWQPLIVLAVIYLISALFFSFESMKKAKPNVKIICLGLPAVFFLIHFAYGLGTAIGLIKMPYFVLKNHNYNLPFPIKAEKEERQNG
ncbi:MAG: glycosyltransferase family 2 protein, partial [Candidatus Omnitrophota bacterium]